MNSWFFFQFIECPLPSSFYVLWCDAQNVHERRIFLWNWLGGVLPGQFVVDVRLTHTEDKYWVLKTQKHSFILQRKKKKKIHATKVLLKSFAGIYWCLFWMYIVVVLVIIFNKNIIIDDAFKKTHIQRIVSAHRNRPSEVNQFSNYYHFVFVSHRSMDDEKCG